jgi:hypothetical protein
MSNVVKACGGMGLCGIWVRNDSGKLLDWEGQSGHKLASQAIYRLVIWPTCLPVEYGKTLP